MDTIFIINPAAGKRKNIKPLIDEINKVGAQAYVTRDVNDACRFVRTYCNEHGAARFIAVGGDGTLSEVLNGAIDFPDSVVGILPMGTGNDFCRNFNADFMNLSAQLNGNTLPCDAIRYSIIHNGNEKHGVCVNMFNIGFDCNVADMTAHMKKKPFISGSLAYFLSIFAILIKKKGADLKITLDGRVVHNGKLLLNSIANGCYCGGGIKSNPTSVVNDGVMDVNVIQNISRLNFLTKLPFYMKGTHIKLRNIEKIITAYKCESAKIESRGGEMRICIDGEIFSADSLELKLVHNAFNFNLPDIACPAARALV